MRIGLNPLSFVVSLVIGGLIGFFGGPAVVLVIWAVVGFGMGWFSSRKKAAFFNGAVYGFGLAYVFMVAGYSGSDSLASKLLPFVLFGLVGAVCGATLATLGRLANRRR